MLRVHLKFCRKGEWPLRAVHQKGTLNVDFYQERQTRNAAVPKAEVLIPSPISSRLGDGDTGPASIFVCAKEEDYECAWGTPYRHFYKLKSL